MEWQVEECIEEFKHNPSEEGAARLIICLINNKENIYWDDSQKRLRCAAEVHNDSWASLMKELTKVLGITTRDEYTKIKYKYNLTQF
jgi:hypothetical protein